MIIDTHTHLFNPEFDIDRIEMIARAIDSGVMYMLMPNVDIQSIGSLKKTSNQFPQNCLPMMGIHPCSIGTNYKRELNIIQEELYTLKYIGVGEIGLDLHWDKTFQEQQAEAFIEQCRWANELGLPVSMHTREATPWAIELLRKEKLQNLKGVFHCFSGSVEEAKTIIGMGFSLGIGGVVTYKNSNLKEILSQISLTHIVLETDAPYLAPVPFRGKRNEPSHLIHVVKTLADIYQESTEKICTQTSINAKNLFSIESFLSKNYSQQS